MADTDKRERTFRLSQILWTVVVGQNVEIFIQSLVKTVLDAECSLLTKLRQ